MTVVLVTMKRTRCGWCYGRYIQFLLTFASLLTSIEGHVLEFTVEPSDTVVESGHSAVLDCVAKASVFNDSYISLQWLDKDKHPLSFIGDLYRSQLANGSLYISSVLEDQGLTGTYQCKATLLDIGSIVSRTALLSIASLSGFLQEPRDVTVYPGQKAHFACRVQTSPVPRVKWLKDERPLQLDDLRMAVLPSGALEIDEVQYSDQGSYRCNVSGLNQYRLSNKATLIVNGDQEQAASISAPSFIAQPRSQSVIEGQTVTLDCAANGNPNPSIIWLKDGLKIDMAYLDSRYKIVGTTSSLQITNIQEADAGTYQCRAENREDSLDATATIQVQVPPKIVKRPQDKTEIVNKDVELSCKIYGKPEPKIQWLKNGEALNPSDYYQLVNGNNLKILGLLMSDSGLFQCTGINSAGNVQASARLKVLQAVDESSEMGGLKDRVPGSPHDVRALIVKARFVTLNWKPPAVTNGDIIVYSIYYRQDGSERERVQNTTRSRHEEVNIAGLLPAKVYHFRVVAYNANGAGQSSESLKLETLAEEHVPSAPLQVIVTPLGPYSIHVSWKPPEIPNGHVQRYKVYYMQSDSSVEHHIESVGLEATIGRLAVFTEYSVWVVGVNHNGPGSASQEQIVKTYSSLPSAPPYNVTLEPASSTSVIVRWEPPPLEDRNGVITGYKLKYRKQGRKGETITTPGDKRIYTLTELDRASMYQVRLWAINVNGTGPGTAEWEEVMTFENDLEETSTPGEPGPLKVKPAFDRIYIMWTPPQTQNIKVRNYILGWGKGLPDTYVQNLDEKTRFHTIENLEPNSDYVISLRASNEIGAGKPVYANVRTRDEPPPEVAEPLIPPVGLKAQVSSASSVVLYWTDTTLSKSQIVHDNRVYMVRYQAANGLSRPRYVNVTDLNVLIGELKANTLYEFSVKLIKGRTASPWSMVVQNVTQEAAPSTAPRDLRIVPNEQNSQMVQLTWQPPKQQNGHITGYIIFYTTDNTRQNRDWLVEGVVGDKHEATVNGLSPSTNYFFKIQARNSQGYGPFSQVVNFRTGANVGFSPSDKALSRDGRVSLSTSLLLYIIGGSVGVVTILTIVIVIVCCRRRDSTSTPERAGGKKGYQKGLPKSQDIKPPDLWIHHDQMELKALEKGHATNDGASSSGAMTLPRSVGANDYDAHDNHPSNSLDKHTYVPSYMGVSPDDKSKRIVKPKPIMLPVESKPPRDPLATSTALNSSSLSQPSGSDVAAGRPPYPRTQYTISRAHVTLDPSGNQTIQESPYAAHSAYDSVGSTASYSSQPPPIAHVPPSSNYAPGMSVLAESQGGKRLVPHQGPQGHPLKSFSVPAPPPISAPGTPQAKHVVSQITVRPNSSPYKKPLPSLTGTPTSRISSSHPPPYTAEEVQRLAPSHSTEELNQEMANLEGLMKDLNAITASEFEC